MPTVFYAAAEAQGEGALGARLELAPTVADRVAEKACDGLGPHTYPPGPVSYARPGDRSQPRTIIMAETAAGNPGAFGLEDLARQVGERIFGGGDLQILPLEVPPEPKPPLHTRWSQLPLLRLLRREPEHQRG